MGLIEKRLNEAADYALRGSHRSFYLGAMALRKDGATVFARNAFSTSPTPNAHAEFRLCRKLDVGSIVYVARIIDSGWAMSKPCNSCMFQLKAFGVKKVYYTISPGEYGYIDVKSYIIETIAQGVRLPLFAVGRWNRGNVVDKISANIA